MSVVISLDAEHYWLWLNDIYHYGVGAHTAIGGIVAVCAKLLGRNSLRIFRHYVTTLATQLIAIVQQLKVQLIICVRTPIYRVAERITKLDRCGDDIKV